MSFCKTCSDLFVPFKFTDLKYDYALCYKCRCLTFEKLCLKIPPEGRQLAGKKRAASIRLFNVHIPPSLHCRRTDSFLEREREGLPFIHLCILFHFYPTLSQPQRPPQGSLQITVIKHNINYNIIYIFEKTISRYIKY